MKKKYNHLTVFLILILFTFGFMSGCKNKNNTSVETISDTELTEDMLYRPNFHFTPKGNWMNDPNGMFYLAGVYHLFFQYYPDDNVWGPMHWGHAISDDMFKWEEQEIALYPDSLGYIFSGSAVVDHNNTSGLGDGITPPVIAIFTYHDPDGDKENRIDFQYQGIAFSNDKGKSWNKYEGNPVLPNPGIRDFRDPKVLWDSTSEQWIMVLAADDEAQFYGSEDLINWTYLSSFGKTIGAHGGVWECPDLFPMQVQSSDETKWVLIQSLNPGSPNGGSGTQYFIGDFDGKEFILDPLFESQLRKEGAVWLDYGRDNYAGVTWSNIPAEDNRKLFIGWMSNWDYAQVVPTEAWRSAMTVARELNLHKSKDGFLIKSFPVGEIESNFEKISEVSSAEFKPGQILNGTDQLDVTKARIDMEIYKGAGSGFSLSLKNDSGDELKFGYDEDSSALFIDRTKAGDNVFSEKFANIVSKAPFEWVDNKVSLTILLDKTSVELFVNEGERVMTEIFFPATPFSSIWITEASDEMRVEKLNAFQLK